MANFYHIFLDPTQGFTNEQIKEKMNLAIDWFKYDSKNWIVYTTSDAKTWYGRLEPFIKAGGHCFICKLNTNDYWGFMSKDLWAWVQKIR